MHRGQARTSLTVSPAQCGVRAVTVTATPSTPQAKQFQAQEQMTTAAAEQMVGELMAQNQAVVDEMARLQDERDGLQVGRGGCTWGMSSTLESKQCLFSAKKRMALP